MVLYSCRGSLLRQHMNGSQLTEQKYTIEPPRLTKTFEVKTSQGFTLPVAYFAHIIDFRSWYYVLIRRHHLMLQQLLHVHCTRCIVPTMIVLQTMLPHIRNSTCTMYHALACCPTLLWQIFGHHVEETHHTDQHSAPQLRNPTVHHPMD